MKKALVFVFLLSLVYQFASAAAVMEAGTWQRRRSLNDEFKKKRGTFIPTLEMNDFSLNEAHIKARGYYQDAKRFFYVDDKGYTVIGRDVPEIIKERHEIGEGDLIVNGSIHVMGDIYGDFPSATLASSKIDEIGQLREEVKLLRREIDALKESLR